MQDLIVVGLGQLGALLGATALRLGIRVTPLVRHTDRHAAFATAPFDTPLLVAVGEGALQSVVEEVPKSRRNNIVLIQNELFPSTWTALGITAPTVAVVWFSKKEGRPVEVARESAVCGPHAALTAQLMQSSGAPCVEVDVETRDLHLVAKFAFILAINSLGVLRNDSLRTWLETDRERCEAAIRDGITLGCAHLGHDVDKAQALQMAVEGMEGLGDYPARGRTAAQRLERALTDAKAFAIVVPALDTLAAEAASAP